MKRGERFGKDPARRAPLVGRRRRDEGEEAHEHDERDGRRMHPARYRRAIDRGHGPQADDVDDADDAREDGGPDRHEIGPGQDLVGAEQVTEPDRDAELERTERPQVHEARVHRPPGPHAGRPPGQERGPQAPATDGHRHEVAHDPREALLRPGRGHEEDDADERPQDRHDAGEHPRRVQTACPVDRSPSATPWPVRARLSGGIVAFGRSPLVGGPGPDGFSCCRDVQRGGSA